MNIPLFMMCSQWLEKLGTPAKLLVFDVIRMAHTQYPGIELQLNEPRGISVTYDRSASGLSKDMFRKARRELCFAGVLTRVVGGKSNKPLRDAFTFRIPA